MIGILKAFLSVVIVGLAGVMVVVVEPAETVQETAVYPPPPVAAEVTAVVRPLPTAQPTAQPTAVGAEPPLRIVWPAVGLDARIVPFAIDQTPATDAAWWPERGAPGEGENVVVWGHNYSVFRPLERAGVGQMVEVHTETLVYVYQVDEMIILQEMGAPLEQRYANGALALDPTGYERLTVITCWPFPAAESHRLILFAKLVEKRGI